MANGKVMEGVFALNKPPAITSAQALRELQTHFNPSKLFKPWVSVEQNKRAREIPNQRNRRKLKKIMVKLGHGGTLDPMATGVLIAGVGKGTKVLQSFLECTKTYETTVLFGAATDTYDTTGKILKRGPVGHITKERIEQALGAFRGKIMQRPPIFSALKMDGKPLYEYAREGKEIPRKIEKRPVEVVEMELVEFMEAGSHSYVLPEEEASAAEKKIGDAFQATNMEEITGKEEQIPKPTEESTESKKRKLDELDDELTSERPASKKANIDSSDAPIMAGSSQEAPKSGPPAAKIRMTVTSGFYVRSLAFDLGQALGSQGVMASLVRTRQGKFELGKNVMEYSDFAKGEDVWGPKLEAMLEDWSATYKPFSSENSHLGEASNNDSASKEDSIKEESAPGPQSDTVEPLQHRNDPIKFVKEEESDPSPKFETVDSDVDAQEIQDGIASV